MLVRWPTALQGALAAEESLFNYKSFQTPHFSQKKKKRKRILGCFSRQIISLSQTPLILPFSLQSSRQCYCTKSSSPWFYSLDLMFRGVDAAFQLQSTPFSFYRSFVALSCLIKCFITFPSFIIASQHVIIIFLACFLACAMIYGFDVVGLALLGQDMSKFNVCTQIHILLDSLPRLRLDLHAFRLLTMFTLRSTCLCVLCHVYAQIYMPMYSLPCLCLHPYAFRLLGMFTLRCTCQCLLCHVYAQIYMLLYSLPCLRLDLYL